MKLRGINAADTQEPSGRYSQAYEASGFSRTLYISGQIPARKDGAVPESFEEQARLTWANIEAQLKAADMTLDNIVKHTTFLSDRRYCERNGAIRRAVLGQRKPALTVVIAGIFDEAWLLEIEAVAVA